MEQLLISLTSDTNTFGVIVLGAGTLCTSMFIIGWGKYRLRQIKKGTYSDPLEPQRMFDPAL